MAIVQNTLSGTNTPYFSSFLPFSVPQNTSATNNIFDMVSINYTKPVRPPTINTGFGAENTYSFILQIKNITTNMQLSVQLTSDNFFIISENNFILGPGNTRGVNITTNTSHINDSVENPSQTSNIKLLVRNITNNLAFINLSAERLPPALFSTEIIIN